tara:strand:+ start:444 stop:1010 length:567 start_codon:yes stop_codon:yes gene_type:complete
MKKILLTLFVLFFSSSVFAENITDFEIGGMSVGKSLLNYMSEKQIKKNIGYVYPDKKYTTTLFEGSVEKYDLIGFDYKTTDSKYLIYGIFGFINFSNNINACYQKQDKIVKELEKLFNKNFIRDWGILVYNNHDSSTYRPINYEFDSGDAIQISCTNYPEEPNQNNLKVSIMMREYKEYLYTDAVTAK